jgi:GNAT superfamily N-acetyltransferase
VWPQVGIAMIVRDPTEAEIGPLAQLWYAGWQDAHERLVPAELARMRTLQSFQGRLAAALHRVRVAGPVDAPLGFCMIKDDELNQLYVSSEARGSGIAARLLADAEARISAGGSRTAWLACAIGNHRAARFYEKQAWVRAAAVTVDLETESGTYPLEVWRYEKLLQRQGPAAPVP